MNRLILAIFAGSLLAGQSVAKAEGKECTTFVHETNPDVRVEDGVNYLTVKDGEETWTYLVAIGKIYGQLFAIAYDNEGINGTEMPYRYLNLNGTRVLIMQASVFYPDCK